MTSIDGRVTGLGMNTMQALQKINTKDGIDEKEVAQIKEGLQADGMDANTDDLLDELMSNQSQITIESKEASFGPLILSFDNVPQSQSRLTEQATNDMTAVRVLSMTSGPEPTPAEIKKDQDQWLKKLSGAQHVFHKLHLGAEVTEKLAHFLSHHHVISKMMKNMPDKMQNEILKMLAETVKQGGDNALGSLAHKLEHVLTSGIGKKVAIVGDAVGAGYYGALATGANYPNVTVSGTEYEVRPSARTRTLAGITAGLSGGSIAATATGAGAGVGIGLSIGSLITSTITDWSLERDKDILKDVVENVLHAPNGAALQEGLNSLRAKYGSLSEVQQVLGQAPVSQSDGSVVKKDQDQSNAVDRDLVGTVANRILESAIKGELPEAEARKAIGELMSGVSTRWTSDDDVAQSFVNQIFLKFGKNPEDFKKALSLLGPDVRLAMFKMLDGGITWGETGLKGMDWLLNESTQDKSEAKVMEYLAEAETDVTTKGRMIAHLMDGATRQRFEDLAFQLIDGTYQDAIKSGSFKDFNKLLGEIKLDKGDASMLSEVSNELDADRAGKVLAWMIQSGAPASQVEAYIKEMSSQWTNDDDVTSEFLKELKVLKIDPSKLAKSLSQGSISLLMNNLEAGWTTNSEYSEIDQLAGIADGKGKADIINRLMAGKTFERAETSIAKIVKQANPQQLQEILARVNTKDLGDEMEDSAEYSSVLQKILNSGDDVKLAGYINGGDEAAVIKAYETLSSSQKAKLGEQAKVALFKHFVNSGRFADTQTMLKGVSSPGLRKEMATYLANHVTNFTNATEAGKAAAWVMAQGNQNDIDTCFSKISGKWFGKGGEIVKAALDQARENRLDIRGKLSMNTLESMVGSLNTAWTKMFGDYGENLKYVRELASMVNTEGKTAIVKNLMDYWTPGQAETLIHDIFRDTTDKAAFTQLVNNVGPGRISSELENRQELGRVMAFMLQRYQGNLDTLMNNVMDKWSSASIQSDDILQAMVQELGGGKGILDGGLNSAQARQQLSRLSNDTLDTMIDWSDDAFRDGNVMDLDPETEKTLQILRASK